jgi:hypothetical protein
VILDLTVTCALRGSRIQPDEVVTVGPQALRCPKCQQGILTTARKTA